MPDKNVPAIVDKLHASGLRTEGHEHLPDMVACVGTTMCRLAVSDTPDAYHRLLDAFSDDEAYWRKIGPLRVNLTGCPNNCAQAWIADIGLRGRRIRNDAGSSDEAFTILIGGKLHGTGRIAEACFDVRTEELVPAIRRILDAYLAQRQDEHELFCDFIDRVGVAAFNSTIPA